MQGRGLKGGHWGIRSGGPQRKCILRKHEQLLQIQPGCFLKMNRTVWVSHPSSPLLLPSSLPLLSAIPTRKKIIVFCFPTGYCCKEIVLGVRSRKQTCMWTHPAEGSSVMHLCVSQTPLLGACLQGRGADRISDEGKIGSLVGDRYGFLHAPQLPTCNGRTVKGQSRTFRDFSCLLLFKHSERS